MGACCFDEECVATNSEEDCTAMGGDWFLEQECPAFNCPWDLVCPDQYVIFGQDADGTIASISEESQFLTLFDNFSGLEDPILDVHWWGITGFNDGVNWFECTEDPIEFTIQFYNDDGAGKPDISAPVCSYTASLTGVDTYNLFAGFTVYYYSYDLPTECVMTEGWVSIRAASDPNCWFLWHNSVAGDLISWQYDESAEPDSQWTQPDDPPYDLSICLTSSTGPDCYEYLPGDANMFNGQWPPATIGGDVTFLVNYFRGSPASNPCFISDGFWCSADVNGDCNVIGSDVTRLVQYFRGAADIEICVDRCGPPCYPPPGEPPVYPVDPPTGWPNCQ